MAAAGGAEAVAGLLLVLNEVRAPSEAAAKAPLSHLCWQDRWWGRRRAREQVFRTGRIQVKEGAWHDKVFWHTGAIDNAAPQSQAQSALAQSVLQVAARAQKSTPNSQYADSTLQLPACIPHPAAALLIRWLRVWPSTHVRVAFREVMPKPYLW
jgi:hypothetical protein